MGVSMGPGLTALTRIFRGASSAEAARIGTRALTADGHPALGYMPGTDNLYMAVTHSGITLAPLVGRLVAEEVTGGTSEHDLSTYRPDRFDTVATSPAG